MAITPRDLKIISNYIDRELSSRIQSKANVWGLDLWNLTERQEQEVDDLVEKALFVKSQDLNKVYTQAQLSFLHNAAVNKAESLDDSEEESYGESKDYWKLARRLEDAKDWDSNPFN